MIKIKLAKESSVEVLALLGRITYVESHGCYIEDKDDLSNYVNQAFNIARLRQDLSDPNVLFYIVYSDDLPVGFAKLVLNATNESIHFKNSCQLEKIYILNDFIALKIGQQLLTFVERKVQDLQKDAIWLSVYVKNNRAINFYERNGYQKVGELNFSVNGTEYLNDVFLKKI